MRRITNLSDAKGFLRLTAQREKLPIVELARAELTRILTPVMHLLPEECASDPCGAHALAHMEQNLHVPEFADAVIHVEQAIIATFYSDDGDNPFVSH